MSFKKVHIKKIKKERGSKPLIIIWLISVVLVFFVWFFLINNTDIFKLKLDEIDSELTVNIDDNKDEENIYSNEVEKKYYKEKEIKKLKENKINILLAWIWGWNHDAPNLTDTIILASINIDTKIISMLSIPRDLYVSYSLNDETGKINRLFAKHNFLTNSKQKAMKELRNKVSEITGQDIDYYVNVDFKWFEEIINTIWWIELTLEENFVDYSYPDWNWWYKTLFFKKWTWIFDWENALKYVRSRHSTSDFDRSLRQQQVLSALKEKLSWSYFLTSPLKIKELYEVFVNNVFTDLNLTTLVKLAYSLNSNWDFKIISSNINDSCFYWSDTCEKGWFLYVPNRDFFNWQSILLINWTDKNNLDNYKSLNEYTDIIFNNPELYVENYEINIFNSLRINNLAWLLSNDIVKYWFNIPEINSIWNTTEKYEKSVIYYNNIPDDSKTIQMLKRFFKWEFKKIDTPIYSKNNAKIEIIIWEDYLLKNSPFKF